MPKVSSLKGKTLGIVGLGEICSELPRMALSIGMGVVYHDKFRREKAEAEWGIIYAELDDLLMEADYVSINCPLNDETRRLIGRRELSLMRKTAYLVNTARGAIVDREALIETLATRNIAGAAFDVFWEEPLTASYPMLSLDNLIVTPHNSATDPDVWREISLMTVEDVMRVLRGETPTHIIPELSSRLKQPRYSTLMMQGFPCPSTARFPISTLCTCSPGVTFYSERRHNL